MRQTIRLITTSLIIVAAIAACKDKHDDFDFTGTVVDYEECNGISEMGYAVALSSPSSTGDSYTTRANESFDNVVVIYGADRVLKANSRISGSIYIDNNYSKSTCSRHYTDRDVPEAVFTKLTVEK